ncbi:MAG: hypothetical protein N2484_14750 [Clostridia bacterium]|nr:hypothetical protein [Clostridia bacterium]
MSLFLGKIHHWLYNKILWFEEAEKEIIKLAEDQGLSIEKVVETVNEKYGEPTGRKPLEEIIDTSNIHGWLQQKIASAELRQAMLITRILGEKPELREPLVGIFSDQGTKAARDARVDAASPDEIFRAMNDYLLEGMPCDRVSELVADNENEYAWKTTMCLHQPYWEEAQGDVQNFYDLREAWISAFVKTVNPEFKYEKSANGINRIIRK